MHRHFCLYCNAVVAEGDFDCVQEIGINFLRYPGGSYSDLYHWNSTGSYANAEGKGTYKVVGQGFGCDPNKPPKTFALTIKAKGDLSY